ncbi:MAG: tyrosine-type recombinase/integrase [Halioglobus sp.]|nr:tyrosine-type recombinase/integrase [Halioglobus sp.]
MGFRAVILPTKFNGPTHRRLAPFIFSEKDIIQLMRAAENLAPIGGLRAASMQTLMGLLASSGLRPGEAVRLQNTAVDLDHQELSVLQSKGWRQRIVPLSMSTVKALRHYVAIRDCAIANNKHGAFFLLDDGRAMDIGSADYAFKVLRKQQGFEQAIPRRSPRLYDFRHSFVCHRILAWYQAGENVNRLLPILSRYLGHKKVSDTYWYMSVIPELMACVSQRFADFLNIDNERGES